MSGRSNSILRYGGLLLALTPSIPLLLTTAGFTIDWTNHVWLISYFGEYFRWHQGFPDVVSTHEAIGMPYPVFYGYLFYPILAIPGVVAPADLVLRLAAVAAWALRFAVVRRTAGKLGAGEFTRTTLALVVSWAIYPVTNLYNRGAIPEFFAATGLVVGTCLWIQLLVEAEGNRRLALANGAVVALTFAFGSHPITAQYGAFSLAGIVLATGLARGIRPVATAARTMLFPMALAALCLSAWGLATWRFNGQVNVGRFVPVAYFPGSYDNVWARLSPIPLADRFLPSPPTGEMTPSIDASINLPLVLVLGAIVTGIRPGQSRAGWRPIAAAAALLAAGGLLTVLSVRSGSMERLGVAARSIQYAYRLVTYINLSFLAATLVLLLVRRSPAPENPWAVGLLSVALLAAATGLGTKLARALRAAHPVPAKAIDLQHLPAGFYGRDAYSIPGASVIAVPGKATFAPGTPVGAAVPPAPVVPANSPVLESNVQPFAWNRLEVSPGNNGSAVASYSFQPTPAWRLLDRVARPLFVAWFAATAAFALAGELRRRHSPQLSNG